MIQDSGNRREFETGAVRDMANGKGRFDLVPLNVMKYDTKSYVIFRLCDFMIMPCENILYDVLRSTYDKIINTSFLESEKTMFPDKYTMWIEVSKHFEEGALKYGERNWEKGLPINCYIDSAIRHYIKYLRGDDDERHDRAFCWNIIACIATMYKQEGNKNADKDG